VLRSLNKHRSGRLRTGLFIAAITSRSAGADAEIELASFIINMLDEPKRDDLRRSSRWSNPRHEGRREGVGIGGTGGCLLHHGCDEMQGYLFRRKWTARS